MAEYRVTSTQRFTEQGVLGVWTFVGGPVAAGLGYWWLLSELAGPSYRQGIFGPVVLMIAGGLASLVGCVLLLVGRQHDITIRTGEARKDQQDGKQLWS